jgi:hypothetical protein
MDVLNSILKATPEIATYAISNVLLAVWGPVIVAFT